MTSWRSYLRPDYLLASIMELNPRLVAERYQVLALDVDHTVTHTCKERRIRPETCAIIEACRKEGVHICLLTNTLREARHERVKEIARAVQADHFICCDGYRCKPSPWGYQQIIRYFACAPERILGIGNNPFTDILGAKLSGCDAALVRNSGVFEVTTFLEQLGAGALVGSLSPRRA